VIVTSIHCISEKSPFYICDNLVRCRFNFGNFWQKHNPGKWNKHIFTAHHTWNVRSVVHTGALPSAVHATGRLLRRWHAVADQTMHRPGGASDQQCTVSACSRHAPARHPIPYSPLYSALDYLVVTSLGQWSALSRGPKVQSVACYRATLKLLFDW